MSEQFIPIIAGSIRMDTFTKDLQHCTGISMYLANFISTHHADSSHFNLMISSVLNELLKIIIIQHKQHSQLTYTIHQNKTHYIADFSFFVSDHHKKFFDQFFSHLTQHNDYLPPIHLYQIIANYRVILKRITHSNPQIENIHLNFPLY